THAEGIKRVRELRSKEYAFTTDAENDGEAKAAATLQHYKDINSNHVLTKNEITSNLLAKSNLPTDSESEKSDDVDDKESRSNDTTTDSECSYAAKTNKQKKGPSKKAKNMKKSEKLNQGLSILQKNYKKCETEVKTDFAQSSKSKLTQSSARRLRETPTNILDAHQGSTTIETVTDSRENKHFEYEQRKDKEIPRGNVSSLLISHSDTVRSNRNRMITATGSHGLEESNLSEYDIMKLTYVSLKKLMAEFVTFKEDMIEWRQTMERRTNVKNNNEVTPRQFLEKHQLNKLKTIEDFKAFDCSLKMDAEFHQDFLWIVSSSHA
ncbi:hypothetical protein PV325_012993, partial [Microctonus aethiopoides]